MSERVKECEGGGRIVWGGELRELHCTTSLTVHKTHRIHRTVFVYHGAIPTTRIVSLAHSHAKFFTSMFMAALLMP